MTMRTNTFRPPLAEFILVSPSGVWFTGTNLKKFLRDHADLFDPEDLKWTPLGGCRAYTGLGQLLPYRKHAKNHWKGWHHADPKRFPKMPSGPRAHTPVPWLPAKNFKPVPQGK